MDAPVEPDFAGEFQLLSWSVTHGGGVKIVFALPDEQSLEPFRCATVRKGNQAGQRYMAVLVEIGADEQPVGRQPGGSSALALSAALVCKNYRFQRFAAARSGASFSAAEDREMQAAEMVRGFCAIDSRRQLDTDPAAASRFRLLMAAYRDWLHDEARAAA